MECPLCHSSSTEKVQKIGDYTLYECKNCTNGFWFPLKMASGDWYANMENNKNDILREGYAELHQPFSKPGLSHEMFLSVCPIKKGSLLDVGCGNGSFIKVASERYETYGIDFDYNAIYAAKKAGLQNVFVKDLASFKTEQKDKKFDVITFFEVLEHQDDPQNFIREIGALLRGGGVIAGSVPSHKKMQPFGRGDMPPNHLLMFTAQGLHRFFSSCGFTNIFVEEIISQEAVRYSMGFSADALYRLFKISDFDIQNNSLNYRSYLFARKFGKSAKPVLNSIARFYSFIVGKQRTDELVDSGNGCRTLYFQAIRS